MISKTRNSLTDSEKQKILSDAIKILTCGDAKIVNAFAAKIEEALEIVRSEKGKPTRKKSCLMTEG